MYLGNQPALSYTSFAKQDFTTSATTSYTLDQPVANANELALFINFVRQEPTTAYTASGTSLTLTSATSASDDMYCVFLGKAVQTVNPPSGSVGASQIVDGSIALGKLSATGTKDATTFLRGDNTFASAGGVNTPAFFAYRTADQSISSGAQTKIQFNNVSIDTDSAFDNTTNYRWTCPAGKGGKYVFFISLKSKTNSNNMLYNVLNVKKNGSVYQGLENNWTGNTGVVRANGISFTFIDEVSAGDYYEGFAEISATSPYIVGNEFSFLKQTRFGAFKIIE